MDKLELSFEDTENLNKKYADILELTASRLRSLNYKISKRTMLDIEKISKDIIEQGRDEVELEKSKSQGKIITSENNLAYRMCLEENINTFKLQGGDKTEDDIDSAIGALVDLIKDEKDNEFQAIDEETKKALLDEEQR